jgi:Methyltransferase FkbM domain
VSLSVASAHKVMRSPGRFLPQPLLTHCVHPVINGCRNFGRRWIAPGLEMLRLRWGAACAKIVLRLPGPAAEALGRVDKDWEARISDVLSCPDNAAIPRCSNAGKVEGSCIFMHNNLRIRALSYYGAGMLNLLVANRGVHEPQEEKAFQEILPLIPSGAVMVELGSYWGFYSLWFASKVEQARCYLVEPDPRNLEAGRQNFSLNGRTAEFICAAVGNRFSTQLLSCQLVTLPELCHSRGISHINVLHADIQGAEHDMLLGAEELFAKRVVDFVFISTHGKKMHCSCREFLKSKEYRILCDVPPSSSYSVDGLVVARRSELPGPQALEVSLKSPNQDQSSA